MEDHIRLERRGVVKHHAKRRFSKDSGHFLGIASLAAKFKMALSSDHTYTASILVSKKDRIKALSDFSGEGGELVYRLHALIEMALGIVQDTSGRFAVRYRVSFHFRVS